MVEVSTHNLTTTPLIMANIFQYCILPDDYSNLSWRKLECFEGATVSDLLMKIYSIHFSDDITLGNLRANIVIYCDDREAFQGFDKSKYSAWLRTAKSVTGEETCDPKKLYLLVQKNRECPL